MEDDENKISLSQKPLRKVESVEGALLLCVIAGAAPIIGMAIAGILFRLLFH